VSNVKAMDRMFQFSKFNRDISNWDVSGTETMCCMFAHSDFDGDISQWDVSGVKSMWHMFENSKFSGDISGWDFSSVKSAEEMLINSKIPDNVKATIMLKLSMNDECELDKIVEGYKEGDDVIKFVLNNFKHEDICYAFKKANIPYKKVIYLVKEMLKIDCLYDIYHALYGKMIDDMLDI